MHIPPDWGIFSVLIVSFLIFWLIFDWLFFRPFLKLLGNREQRLKDLSERTEQLIKEEKAAGKEHERELARVRREAMTKREVDRRQAEAQAAQLLEETRAKAKASLDAARGKIENQVAAAERELQTLGRSLAVELAERVLGRPLNGKEQSRPNG
jgi:F-type H+-transporting ATPase subunit b